MSEQYLHRKDTPFGQAVWERIDQAVVEAAKSVLCGRKLIKTEGPYGLGLKAIPSADAPVDAKLPQGVEMAVGCATPLVVIRKGFILAARDVAAFEQLGLPLDLAGAIQAAIDCARQEDSLIFTGVKSLALKGLLNADHAAMMKLKPWDDVGAAAENIIQAATALDDKGFQGPYALALAPKLYNLLLRQYPQANRTELEHIRQIAADGVVKAQALTSGGILICTAGAMTTIILGQDLMAGFVGPQGNSYEFTISETIALWIRQPESICILK